MGEFAQQRMGSMYAFPVNKNGGKFLKFGMLGVLYVVLYSLD